jgi:hypothetical protein
MNRSGFSRKRPTVWILAVPLVLYAVFICFWAEVTDLFDERWNLDKIEHYLGVSIPEEAQGLSYSSGTNRYVHVELSFRAPPEAAIAFTRHFCDGVLHKGYDPFNAINVDESVPRGVKIDMIDYYTRSYYSYSPRTSQAKAGVFCFLGSGLYWVLVDETDPALYAIKFKHTAARNRIYADVKPVADFPILVRGLMPELHGGYSAYERICLDLDPDTVRGSDDTWRSLIGIGIRVLIDGKAMTGAYVNQEGRLVRQDGKRNFSDPDSELFSYCLIVLQDGLHRMTIQLPPGFDGKTTYSWLFREAYSGGCGSRYPDNDCY